MAPTKSRDSLEFLRDAPEPVVQQDETGSGDHADRLPPSVIDDLMRIPGVDGVWVERDAQGSPVVVLHYTPKGPTGHLPRIVQGLPTKIVGGEPIRAGL